jgi:small subunit ribosomal protein S16
LTVLLFAKHAKEHTVVKLRLMRMGKKKQPFYRVVAADSRSPRNGRFIEIVGTYDPRSEPSTIEIDNSKAVAWLQKGAQATERVEKLLKVSGAWDEFKGLPAGTSVTAPPAPKPVKKTEAPKAEAPAAAPAAEAPAAEEAPAEEAPAEEPAAEAPVEAAPVDEAPAAEAPVEESGT